MYEQMKNGTLAKMKQRVVAYKGQQPFYTNIESYHTTHVIKGDSGEGESDARRDLARMKRRSITGSIAKTP